jgi:ketosteroid isomerase-like protein
VESADSERVEAVRRGHRAFTDGDLTPAKSSVTDDVEWGTTGSWPGLEGTYRGPEALDEWMETIRAEWETFQASMVELLASSEDSIVVQERLSGRGRESGIEVEMDVFTVYRFEGPKIAKRLSFRTPEEALEAV